MEALRRQRAADAHSATSAMELVREFLDQAQLVADEGHGRNNRYRALLLVAAQVALQMDLGLRTIEKELPLHFQRLLVDGVMDFAEQPKDQQNEFARGVALRPAEARVLHQRWTLRALVSQSQNGYLTCSSSSDGDDLSASYQAALGDLTSSHLQIAQSIQATLAEDYDKNALPLQTQLEAFYDLGMYFFSFSGYERAYGCFSRASELLEEFGGDRMTDSSIVTLSKDDRDSLEGYLKACEAVMELRSASEGPATGLTEKAKVELAWEGQDWEQIIDMLQADMVTPELSRFQAGYRTALEQQALRLMRANLDTKASPDDNNESKNLAAPVVRFFYKRIAIANAIHVTLLGDKPDDLLDLESCVCLCARLVQAEIFRSAADAQGTTDTNLFTKLTTYLLQLVVFLLENLDGGDPGKSRMKQFVSRMIELTPAMKAVEGAQRHLLKCGYVSQDLGSDNETRVLAQLLHIESDIRGATKQQCEHFRLIADLSRVFEFENSKEKETFISSLREQVAALATNDEIRPVGEVSKCEWRNLVMFCLVHNCWNTLEQCRTLWKNSPKAQRELEFALSCGSLIQFLSTLSASPLPGVQSSDGSGAGTSKNEFSVTAASKLMADILSKRRQLTGEVSSVPTHPSNAYDIKKEHEAYNEMLDLPVWIVETLVCISAGLLHRAHMRNVCDYRVSFDLTPYGDLAFLQAFAAEDPSPETIKSESGSETTMSSTHFLRSYQSDLIGLLQAGLDALVRRCGREPRWHCAKADLALNPIVRQKLSATSGMSSPAEVASQMTPG